LLREEIGLVDPEVGFEFFGDEVHYFKKVFLLFFWKFLEVLFEVEILVDGAFELFFAYCYPDPVEGVLWGGECGHVFFLGKGQ